MAAKNQRTTAEQGESPEQGEAVRASSPLTKRLMTADFMAHTLGRPTPWITSRLEEQSASPAVVLDGVAYFDAEWLELLREVSEQWAERIARAKREAAAAGA